MDSAARKERAFHAGVCPEVSSVKYDSTTGKLEKDHGSTWTAGHKHFRGTCREQTKSQEQGYISQHQQENGLYQRHQCAGKVAQVYRVHISKELLPSSGQAGLASKPLGQLLSAKGLLRP